MLLAMYVAIAEKAGVDREPARRHAPERHPEGVPGAEGVRLPAAAVDAAGPRHDRASAAAEMPRWHPVSISGYHIREAGSTAAQELAFTLANGFAYVELAHAAGLDVDAFAPRLSFFFNAHIDFFEEIAKYRAARRIWARWMRERYGATDERSLQLRFHTQTAGVSLTAQQPEVNIARTAIEALAGVLGGTQSLHTNSMDEALALPTEKAARIALRTQQVIAHETGVANVADPLGGSWFVEALTDEIERAGRGDLRPPRRARRRLDARGRATRASTTAGSRARSPTRPTSFERKVNDGRRVVVGVNRFTEGNDDDAARPPADHRRARAAPDQAARRRSRPTATTTPSRAALARLRAEAADPERNLMPALIDAVSAYATEGEIIDTLADVFGRYTETPVL